MISRPVIFVLIFLYSCAPHQTSQKPDSLKDTSQTITSAPDSSREPRPVNQQASLLQTSYIILKLLIAKDYQGLSSWVSPSGVRFSPYAFVDTNKDQKLSATEIIDLAKSKRVIEWGNYDGSGEPILLNIDKYFDKFIYDADFQNAEKHSVNEFTGTGNSLNNLKQAYPDALFAEFYFPGTKKNENMDWRALRLVFKNDGGRYVLIAIVHDQWTI